MRQSKRERHIMTYKERKYKLDETRRVRKKEKRQEMLRIEEMR